MPGDQEFDMDAAVADIGSGLGYEEPSGEGPQGAGGLPEVSDKTPEGSPPVDVAPPPEVPALPEPPKTWRQGALSQWASLPAEVRDEVLKREEDMFRGIEQYKADAGYAKSIKEALTPFMPSLQRYNIDPVQHIGALMKAHHDLALGTPEDKLATFQRLAQDYGIDLGHLAPEAQPFVDPQVARLQTELREIRSTITNAEQQRQEAVIAENKAKIAAFAGDPAHPHFDKVSSDMAALLQSGAAKTLEDAYERAVWMNPETRAAEVSRQHAEKTKQGLEEAKRKAEEAKRAAAANVRTSAKSGSGTAAPRSMDDTLQETLAAINARS